MRHAFRALRNRNYRLYVAGQLISLIGTFTQTIGLGWLAYRLTGSPLMLGVIAFASQLPILLLTPLGGVWSDRYDRRRSLLLTQALAALQAAALAALIFLEAVEPWHLVAGAAFLGIVYALDMPLRMSFLSEMIGAREELPNAIALNALLLNGSRLIGPVLGGLIVAAAGEGWCFLLNALSYLAAIAALLAITTSAPAGPRKMAGWLDGLATGLRYARASIPCRTLLGMAGIAGFFGMPYMSLMPAYVREALDMGAETYGLLTGAAGLGAALGMIFLAARKQVSGTESLVAVTLAIAGVGLIGFSASGALWLSLALAPAVGFGIMVTATSVNTILQSIVPEDLRGRIASLHIMAFLGMAPLGHFAAGWVAEHAGARVALAAGGVCLLIGTGWFAGRLAALRQQLAPQYARR